mmetsp:Transcript_20294/g.81071  ORF Transcript_20294/g.81071 Transcript_20294/m.81071 type:complete len:239 (+) Transcript_20294:3233-3949(+)
MPSESMPISCAPFSARYASTSSPKPASTAFARTASQSTASACASAARSPSAVSSAARRASACARITFPLADRGSEVVDAPGSCSPSTRTWPGLMRAYSTSAAFAASMPSRSATMTSAAAARLVGFFVAVFVVPPAGAASSSTTRKGAGRSLPRTTTPLSPRPPPRPPRARTKSSTAASIAHGLNISPVESSRTSSTRIACLRPTPPARVRTRRNTSPVRCQPSGPRFDDPGTSCPSRK